MAARRQSVAAWRQRQLRAPHRDVPPPVERDPPAPPQRGARVARRRRLAALHRARPPGRAPGIAARALQVAELRRLPQAAHPVEPIQADQPAEPRESGQFAQAAGAH
eukprot:gene17384-biopygen4237